MPARRTARGPRGLERAYSALTDVLMMMGRPRESPGWRGGARRHPPVRARSTSTLVANLIEPLVASGEWDRADRVSAAAVRAITANYPHMRLIVRMSSRPAAATTTPPGRTSTPPGPRCTRTAIWRPTTPSSPSSPCGSTRWTDAETAVRDGVARTYSGDMAQIRVWLCAKGLRALAELALARARRDGDAVRTWLGRAWTVLATARDAEAEAAAVTPNAGGWRALAEGEYSRARGEARPSMVGGGGDLGTAGAPAAGGLLPLAPGRGAGRRRRLPRRGQRAAPAAHAVAARIERHPWQNSLSCSPNARGWNSRRRTPGRPTGSRAWRNSSTSRRGRRRS